MWMRLQRGFVVLPRLATMARKPIAATMHVRAPRGPWRHALERVRVFGAGFIIGAGFWTPIFAAMADDPGPWGAVSALGLFVVAGVLGRPGRG
jgi:hypothetical protein